MPKMSTTVLNLPKGTPITISSRNISRRKPATPMEPQHNHFSMESPFTACMEQFGSKEDAERGTVPGDNGSQFATQLHHCSGSPTSRHGWYKWKSLPE